jgi:CheY-like chemotaxis protein
MSVDGKLLQFSAGCVTVVGMSKPLALVYYSNLLPGSQLAVQLQDLGYRVQAFNRAALLPPACEREKPLVVIAELWPAGEACDAIAKLKANPATQHLPVLAYSPSHDAATQARAKEAGVNLLAGHAAVAGHLPQLLDQILQVE